MKKEILKFLVLALLASGAGPASSAVWQWSKTASSNAGADPTINWAEGQSPSSINDSARAQMARSAEWRDDISGSLASAGTSTAYTLSTNELAGGNGIGTIPTDGQMLAFRANSTNGAAATMAVDGGTAFALQAPAGTALPSGTLISGTPYRMQFNLANSAWVIEGLTGNPYSIPLGGLLASTTTTVPNSNFILPAGQCISTTTYAAYWVQQGSPASGGCPGGQFAVLDMRGRVPVPLDNLNGSAANRMTSSATGCGTAFTSIAAVCANGSEGSVIPLAQLPSITSVNAAQSIVVASGGQHIPVSTSNWAQTNLTGTGASAVVAFTAGTVGDQTSFTGNNSITVTSSGTTATARPNVMHSIGVSYFLRVI